MDSRRYVLTPAGEKALPLYIESIGFNGDQEAIDRPQGYDHFHWLQTHRGEGVIAFEQRSFALVPGSGVLLRPGTAHGYESSSAPWETLYLTFGGALASEIAASLHLQDSDYYRWETDTPFGSLLAGMLDGIGKTPDPFGLDGSVNVYRFLLSLQKYGRLHRNTAIARNLERLRPLTDWLESRYADPAIGLDDLSGFLGVSSSGINHLFRDTYGLTPYAYLLHLRLRKAKELLINRPSLPVKAVAAEVGFRDASHFIASFRRSFGMPPDRYRKLY